MDVGNAAAEVLMDRIAGLFETRQGRLKYLSEFPDEWNGFKAFPWGSGGRTRGTAARRRVSLRVRWLALVFCLPEVNYQVEYGDIGLSPENSSTPPS